MSETPSQGAAPYGGAAGSAGRKPMTLHRLRAMREAGEKIAMLTAYDAASAALRTACATSAW